MYVVKIFIKMNLRKNNCASKQEFTLNWPTKTLFKNYMRKRNYK